MAGKLVLLRHGQSVWNLENLFTGWHDVELTGQGKAEAARAAQQPLLPQLHGRHLFFLQYQPEVEIVLVTAEAAHQRNQPVHRVGTRQKTLERIEVERPEREPEFVLTAPHAGADRNRAPCSDHRHRPPFAPADCPPWPLHGASAGLHDAQ